MIQLKDYQQRVLESLRTFLKRSSQTGHPSVAFHEVTEQVYGQPLTYLQATAAGLPADMPYVCLRVPTGGGRRYGKAREEDAEQGLRAAREAGGT